MSVSKHRTGNDRTLNRGSAVSSLTPGLLVSLCLALILEWSGAHYLAVYVERIEDDLLAPLWKWLNEVFVGLVIGCSSLEIVRELLSRKTSTSRRPLFLVSFFLLCLAIGCFYFSITWIGSTEWHRWMALTLLDGVLVMGLWAFFNTRFPFITDLARTAGEIVGDLKEASRPGQQSFKTAPAEE